MDLKIEDFNIEKTDKDISFIHTNGRTLKAIADPKVHDDVIESFTDTLLLYNAGAIGDLDPSLIEMLDDCAGQIEAEIIEEPEDG